MRQPEIARVAGFLLAIALVVPVARSARDVLVATFFLTEFLTGGSSAPLSRVTSPPIRTELPVAGAAVDRYAPAEREVLTPLVLVHGLTPDGKDDERVVRAAGLLARAGFDVAVPNISGLAQWRLRPDDTRPVIAMLSARAQPAVVVGVSVGAGIAILAAAAPAVRDDVRLLLSLGGYASAANLVRFYLTGDYAWDGVRGHTAHDRDLVDRFLSVNADLLDASALRVLSARTDADLAASLTELSPELRRLLDALSPERVVRDVRAPLVLVHGRDDIAVPYTESLRLAHARPANTRVVLVGVVGHVEAATVASRVALACDLLALWSVVYRLVSLA